MREILMSVEAEYRRYRALGEAAMDQLSDAELVQSGPGGANSVAVVAWHMGGNLASRFTDFLTSDGEKPWRNRDEEFAARNPTREEMSEQWERGWSILFDSLASLKDEHLSATVSIRGVELRVYEALHRSLAHASYHVGQIVYVARAIRGAGWRYLSIPPGGTDAYNRNPTRERADAHTSNLEDRRNA